MAWPDVVNGCYEGFGGLMMLLNCYRLYKDKQVKGVSLVTTAFFTSWSFWNLYYYPSLGQWFSFSGGLIIGFFNALWVGMAVYYSKSKK